MKNNTGTQPDDAKPVVRFETASGQTVVILPASNTFSSVLPALHCFFGYGKMLRVFRANADGELTRITDMRRTLAEQNLAGERVIVMCKVS